MVTCVNRHDMSSPQHADMRTATAEMASAGKQAGQNQSQIPSRQHWNNDRKKQGSCWDAKEKASGDRLRTRNKMERKQSKIIGEGYKLYYRGASTARNGVAIILHCEWQDKILEVKGKRDRVMSIKLVVGKRMLNITSAYAPQTGRKRTFLWVNW